MKALEKEKDVHLNPEQKTSLNWSNTTELTQPETGLGRNYRNRSLQNSDNIFKPQQIPYNSISKNNYLDEAQQVLVGKPGHASVFARNLHRKYKQQANTNTTNQKPN